MNMVISNLSSVACLLLAWPANIGFGFCTLFTMGILLNVLMVWIVGSFVEGELLCLSRIFCGGLYKQTVDAVMCILLHTKYHPLQSHVHLMVEWSKCAAAFHVACDDLFQLCCYTLLSGIHSSCPEPGGRWRPFSSPQFLQWLHAVLGEDWTELQQDELLASRPMQIRPATGNTSNK